MKVEVVGHGTRTSSLSAARAVLDGAEPAVACSAFMRRAGMNLVEPQLKALGDWARLVATTVFGGDTTTEALNASLDLGVRVRVHKPIPAWMFELAWEHLRTHGSLTNAHLLADDGLNVKRSRTVGAILARLPGIEVAARRPITLRLVGSGHDRSMTA